MTDPTVFILPVPIPVEAIPDLVIGFGRDLMDAVDPALRDAATRAAHQQPTTGEEQQAIAIAWIARRAYDMLLDLLAQRAAEETRANPGIPWARP